MMFNLYSAFSRPAAYREYHGDMPSGEEKKPPKKFLAKLLPKIEQLRGSNKLKKAAGEFRKTAREIQKVERKMKSCEFAARAAMKLEGKEKERESASIRKEQARLCEKKSKLESSCKKSAEKLCSYDKETVILALKPKDNFFSELMWVFSALTAAKAASILVGVRVGLQATIAAGGSAATYLVWRFALFRIIAKQDRNKHDKTVEMYNALAKPQGGQEKSWPPAPYA
jgi:hypothetical protein